MVDEVGYLAYDAREAGLLFQLVSRRYEHRSLLITTNLPFKRWDTVFPTASCAVALIDRLTHHVAILLLEGRSYRRRDHFLALGNSKAEVVQLTGRPAAGHNPRYVVTTLRQTPRFVYEKVYCGRGDIGRRIRAHPRATAAGRAHRLRGRLVRSRYARDRPMMRHRRPLPRL